MNAATRLAAMPDGRRALVLAATAVMALVVGVGCRNREESKPSIAASAVSPPTTAPNQAPAAASPGRPVRLRNLAPVPSANETELPKTETAVAPGCPNFAHAIARGRAAVVRKDWAAAIAGFDAALRARPLDAAARSERAYVYLLKGDPARALWDLARAESISGGRTVMQQIWYNIGLAFDALGEPEKSRLGLAVAAYYGSASAKRRLGKRSTCTALIDREIQSEAPIVSRFEDLANARGANCALAEPPAGSTPAQRARWQICQGCDHEDHCEGNQDSITRVPSGIGLAQFDFLFARLPSGEYWHSTSTSPFDSTVTTQADYVIATGKDGTPVDLFGDEAGDIFHIVGGFVDAPDAEVTGNGTWSDQDPEWSGQDTKDTRGTGVALCKPYSSCTHVGCGDDELPRGGEIMAPLRNRLRAVVYTTSPRQQVLAVEPQAGEITIQATPGTVTISGSGCRESIAVP